MKLVNTLESWPALNVDGQMKKQVTRYFPTKFVFIFHYHLLHQRRMVETKGELILKPHSLSKACLSITIHHYCRIEPKASCWFCE
jgi:hypothetical protein